MSKAEAEAKSSILVRGKSSAHRPGPAASHVGWRAVGWFGLLLAIIGFADISLQLFRPAFGTPEWEFATIAAITASLPLPTIGLAAVVGALLVNQARIPSMIAAGFLLFLALLILGALVVFLLHLPLALQAASGPQGTAIYRTIARTLIMGPGFGLAYLVAGIVLLRHLPERRVA